MDKQLNRDYIVKNIQDIKENVQNSIIKAKRSNDDVRIMAVTKTVEPNIVNIAIENGINLLGENRVQELLNKYDVYNKNGVDIHFIGTLQTNKVKYIIDKVTMIHSVNSIKLAKEIDKQAKKHNIVMDILCEVNIGYEESKSGILPKQTEEFLRQISQLSNIKVKGLMAIPPFSTNKQEIIQFFDNMYQLFIDIKNKKLDNINMDILSMGMSSDYQLAIESGSSIVRIGSAMFGNRNY